jgi:hypothetical protein
MWRSRVAGLGLIAASLSGAPVAAQVAVVGAEFQINTYTPLFQASPDVSGTANGFVVVWISERDGNSLGVFGKRFSSNGSPSGDEFQVNLYTTGPQLEAKVARLGSGFVVTWASDGQDGDDFGVFARLFGSTGSPIGAEFQVSTHTLGYQRDPSVNGDGSGGFVVVWESSLGDYNQGGVFGQRFSSSGAPLGAQFQVNTYFTEQQNNPDVAEVGQGFVVVWQSQLQDGDSGGIFGQRYDSSGLLLGGEFQVNTVEQGYQATPAVTSNATDFVVVWRGEDGSGLGVFGRRYDDDGVAQAGEFRVNAYEQYFQGDPDVASLGGSFLVVWDNNAEIASRRLDGLGFPDGPDVQVNTHTPEYQDRPSVARVDGLGFVVTWTSQDQDGSEYGIFGRRLKVFADFDIDGNGVVDPLTDTLLALRYAFGFRGATLITGAVGSGCTRCTTPAIEAYLAGKF